MPKISAGLLMYRHNDSQLEVYLTHPGGPFYARKDEGVWSVPKGEVEDNGNDLLQEAIREFKEETNQDVSEPFIGLGSIKHKSGKIVHAWAFEGQANNEFKCNTVTMEWPPRSGKTITFPEEDRAEFFPVAIAKRKLIPGQAELVDRLVERLNQTTQ